MAVDYDIVIIGGSSVGRYAAAMANQLHAKVALVEPPNVELAIPHTTAYLGQQVQQLSNISQYGIYSAGEKSEISVRWAEARQWEQELVANLEAQNSLTELAALGVDVIVGNGQFVCQPHLAFGINHRQLNSRTYLLASACQRAITNIDGLQNTGYITALEVLERLNSPNPARDWVIIGGAPDSIQMAQTLNRLGLNVTLIVKRSPILAQEDPEVAQLIQAILEADGVRVLTGTSISQVKQIQDKKWLQVGNEAIETDEILLAGGRQPDLPALNLAAVGVKWHRQRLQVNAKLQTTNPRIYACGDLLGGYQFANVARYEASIALQNALFFPRFKVDYRSIPWVIFCDPPLARVGLTEASARRIYGQDVVVVRQYFKTLAAAQLTGETTGIFKLIVRRRGEILGAAIVGAQAGELINLLALAMSQKLKIEAIASLAPVYPSFSEILAQIVLAWREQYLHSHPKSQNFWEGFFNLRRNWNF